MFFIASPSNGVDTGLNFASFDMPMSSLYLSTMDRQYSACDIRILCMLFPRFDFPITVA